MWQVSPGRGPLDALMLRSSAGAALPVLASCDVLLHLGGRIRRLKTISDGLRWRLVSDHDGQGQRQASYDCSVGAQTARLTVRWNVHERDCLLEVESPSLAALTLPREAVASSQRVYLPYLHWVRGDDPARIFRFETETSFSGLFLGVLVVLERSGGYTIRDDAVWFGPRPGGTAVLRIVASPRLCDLFPPPPQSRSPGFDVLRQRVLLDSCRDIPFSEEAAQWRELAGHGLTDVVAIRHAWQRDGYDRGYPFVMPASTDMGGDEGLAELSETARAAGWLFALHEMYGATKEPQYSGDMARSATGKLIPFMLDPVTAEQMYEIAPESSARIAGEWARRIHERYRTSAAFLDVHPSVAPWRFARGRRVPDRSDLLSEPGPVAGLIDAVRSCHGGPLIGEGGMHFLWAGRADGFEAEVADGREAPLVVDFALAHVAPASVSYGLGYFQRWGGHQVNAAVPEPMIDAYRTRCVAFGHGAYIASEYLCTNLREAVKEYYIIGGLQRLYLGVPVSTVRYEFDGKFRSAEEALQRTHYPPRVQVTYANGLVIEANVGAAQWRPRPGLALPKDSWVATLNGRLLAGSAEIGGSRADFFLGENLALIDARGDRGRPPRAPAEFGPLRTNSCVLLDQSAGRIDARLIYPDGSSFADLALPAASLSLAGMSCPAGYLPASDNGGSRPDVLSCLRLSDD